MSYSNFQKACEMMQSCSDFECCEGKSEAEIKKAESELGLHFSPQCTEFYMKYDYVIVEGEELFGIQDGAGAEILEGNIVAYTLNDREECNLPMHWVPFYNFGDGSLAYYDYSVLNEFQEPQIIRAYYDDETFHIIEKLADDFGDFLLELMESFL